MKNTTKLLISAGILLSACHLPTLAQQTGGGKTGQLGNEDIDIVKEYQPVVNDAFKINLPPDQDTLSTGTGQALKYSIDPIQAKSQYNTSPIKPVRIKDDSIRKLYKGWVKAGYGLENMPLLDASFNSIRSKNYDAGISLKHLSASGKIKDYGFPGNSRSSAELYGTRYFERFSLGASAGFQADKVHYYGFLTPPELFSKAETKHTMNKVFGGLTIRGIQNNDDRWQYTGALDFYSFGDNLDSRENDIQLSGKLSKAMNNSAFELDLAGQFGEIKQEQFSFGRSIVRFNPRFIIKRDLLTLTVGGRVAVETNNSDSEYRIYPEAQAEYRIIADAVRVYGALYGDLQRNDLSRFAQENPFFGNFVPLVNTNDKLVLKAGTAIRMEHDLMFTAEARFRRSRHLPFFYNTWNADFPNTFTVQYDNGEVFTLLSTIEYKRTEKSSLSASVEYNRYSLDELERPFYAPRLRAGLNGHYRIGEKILVKADVFLNNGMDGLSYTKQDSLVISNVTELKGWVDFNLSVDYRYSKQLSAWISMNNIGFSRYFRWYDYPSYRFLGMAGISYSF
ncbi:MAG: hypothetical protein ACKOQY_03745 [Bacteroidota bacterium]